MQGRQGRAAEQEGTSKGRAGRPLQTGQAGNAGQGVTKSMQNGKGCFLRKERDFFKRPAHTLRANTLI